MHSAIRPAVSNKYGGRHTENDPYPKAQIGLACDLKNIRYISALASSTFDP